ncbi:MAG: biopolymer transporter ExbD [Oceanospirillaceae bacterium]|nr:biopolymer transporter ExbD [Oceanospirillaceae bacterium]MBT10958.1 biopolymer transporter ExbD [Oceanospirillaceae bacterium]|tara:strand:+ start:97 stop:507 length:411 start_codon:yes stop_codon:yes gene_type:complete
MELIRSKKPNSNSDDNLIPLINIVFLLLIFFMVAGQMQKPLATDITLPVSQAKESASAELPLEISVNGDMYLHGEKISAADLQTIITRTATTGPSQLQVLIKADKDMTAEKLDPLLRALNNASVTRIQFLTEESIR